MLLQVGFKPVFENLSDFELFELLKKGDRDSNKAFNELYSRYSPRVYAYCRRFMGGKDEADDIFQETFVRFYESSKMERQMTNVPGFLLRIARNLCVNKKKSESKLTQYEEYMGLDKSSLSDKEELVKLIQMALDLLSDDYREAFVLREYDGLSYNEIAELTNTSLATVKIRIFRAKQKIKEVLQPYLADLTKNE
jgi:RNA polymerase sigma-70 factor (ECF subfamily)